MAEVGRRIVISDYVFLIARYKYSYTYYLLTYLSLTFVFDAYHRRKTQLMIFSKYIKIIIKWFKLA